jgi:hypothetical protein
LNTAIKVQEIYLKRIEETNEKIFGINNTINEMTKQFSGIDTSLYDLKTKIGIY